MKRRLLLRAVWVLAAVAVVVLLVKTLVGDVYHVVSASMAPTIYGIEGSGEWVFVRFDRSRPARNEIVVVRRPEDDTPIVKRVIGRPGECIKIAQGDVLIDRQRLRPSEERPPEVVVFDDRWHKVEERFDIGPEQSRMWRRSGPEAGSDADGGQRPEWMLDARELGPGSDAAMLNLHDPLNDDYLGPDHELVRGQTQANDAHIACEVRFDDLEGEVRLGLKEQADTFEAVLSRADETTAEVAITRRSGTSETEVLATARFPLVTGQWTPLSLENRDNALKLGFAGPGSPLVVIYKENASTLDGELASDQTYGPRAFFGGDGGRFAFRSIRLARDLVYTDRGHIGVDAEIQLGPDEFFLLGDNSAQSRDSREWGPVKEKDIAGRAVRVVWPPSRCRRLGAPAQ